MCENKLMTDSPKISKILMGPKCLFAYQAFKSNLSLYFIYLAKFVRKQNKKNLKKKTLLHITRQHLIRREIGTRIKKHTRQFII